MKKILAGTTALIAVGTLAGAAQAANPIKLSVGGFMNQWFSILDVEDETYNTYNNFAVNGDTEVQFKGETVLDNGLKIAVNINLEAERVNNTGGRNAEQQFATISGGWGQVRVGEMKNAATIVHNQAPGAGAAFSDVSTVLAQGVASGNAVTDLASQVTSVDGVNDAGAGSNAIDYISPMFGPFAFGVTYTPEAFSNGPAREGASSKDLFGAALVYADTWGPVAIAADVAYARFDQLESGPTATSTAQNGMAHGVPVGLKLSYAGFDVGGSYFRIFDNAKVNASGETTGGTSYDGHAWDAGIAYTTGNWKFGYQYYSSSIEGAIQTHGKDKTRIHNGGLAYTMGPGVVVSANAAYLTQHEETNGVRDKRNSLGVITGLLLTF